MRWRAGGFIPGKVRGAVEVAQGASFSAMLLILYCLAFEQETMSLLQKEWKTELPWPVLMYWSTTN